MRPETSHHPCTNAFARKPAGLARDFPSKNRERVCAIGLFILERPGAYPSPHSLPLAASLPLACALAREAMLRLFTAIHAARPIPFVQQHGDALGRGAWPGRARCCPIRWRTSPRQSPPGGPPRRCFGRPLAVVGSSGRERVSRGDVCGPLGVSPPVF